MNEATRKTLVKAADALCEYLSHITHEAAYDVARTMVWLLESDMTEEWRLELAAKVKRLQKTTK